MTLTEETLIEGKFTRQKTGLPSYYRHFRRNRENSKTQTWVSKDARKYGFWNGKKNDTGKRLDVGTPTDNGGYTLTRLMRVNYKRDNRRKRVLRNRILAGNISR